MEIGREACEIDERDLAIAVEITFLPEAGLIEMGGEGEEIIGADKAVQVQIADARGANEDIGKTIGIEQLSDANGGVGMRRKARVIEAIEGVGFGIVDERCK